MKYDDLSKLWKNQALKMIIDFYQTGVNEIAKNENVKSWKITKNSQEVRDAKKEWEFEININTADKTQLMELPRVGETIAEAIIQYREENQGFKKIEEIKNVPRIGDVTFEGIKEKICCY